MPVSRKPRPEDQPRTATHLPGGWGRLPETAYNGGPSLPRVPAARVDRVEAWLFSSRGKTRSLNATAPLLALICALHEAGEHFPVRRRAAEWLRDNGYTTWTSLRPNAVDKALVGALARGEITVRYEETPSVNSGGPSVILRRYLVPCAELLEAYRGAPRSARGAVITALPLALRGADAASA